MKTTLLKNGFIVTPTGVSQTDIAIQDGSIKMSPPKGPYDRTIDITGKYVVPGFVDIHFHGYDLFDFTMGLYNTESRTFSNSKENHEKSYDMLSEKLASFGVTSYYGATLAAPISTLKCSQSYLAEYLKRTPASPKGAKLLGAMLEGTFINTDMAGAQNPELVFEPSIDVFDSIEDQGTIKMANIVPDFGDKSCKLTEYLTAKGIIVGSGHTGGTCDQYENAKKAGLKYSIHFTNGPTGSSYKPFDGGGATEAVLKFDDLYAELICDGYHVNPAYIRDIIKRKGIDKILAVTDCTLIGGSDIKEFNLGGIKGQTSKNGEYLQVVGKKNTLFGSVLKMSTGFKNMLNWLSTDMPGIWNKTHEQFSLDDAITASAKMFATNQSILTGLDKKGFGAITTDAKADLCILDITGPQGDYELKVDSTMVDGTIVYENSK